MSIKFHLPDFAVRYHFNRIFLSMLEHCPQYFYDGVEIASVYGCFPQSLWNGGRTMPGVCDKSFVKKVVRDGYRALIACVTEGNVVSDALHLRLGFKKVSHFKKVGLKFGRWLDVVDYELLLS